MRAESPLHCCSISSRICAHFKCADFYPSNRVIRCQSFPKLINLVTPPAATLQRRTYFHRLAPPHIPPPNATETAWIPLPNRQTPPPQAHGLPLPLQSE